MGGLTPGKQLRRKARRWVVRDLTDGQLYIVLRCDTQPRQTGWGDWPLGCAGMVYDADEWRELSRIRLKPGEGPVEITINIQRTFRRAK